MHPRIGIADCGVEFLAGFEAQEQRTQRIVRALEGRNVVSGLHNQANVAHVLALEFGVDFDGDERALFRRMQDVVTPHAVVLRGGDVVHRHAQRLLDFIGDKVLAGRHVLQFRDAVAAAAGTHFHDVGLAVGTYAAFHVVDAGLHAEQREQALQLRGKVVLELLLHGGGPDLDGGRVGVGRILVEQLVGIGRVHELAVYGEDVGAGLRAHLVQKVLDDEVLRDGGRKRRLDGSFQVGLVRDLRDALAACGIHGLHDDGPVEEVNVLQGVLNVRVALRLRAVESVFGKELAEKRLVLQNAGGIVAALERQPHLLGHVGGGCHAGVHCMRKNTVDFKFASGLKDCILIDNADVAELIRILVRDVIRQVVRRNHVDAQFVGFFNHGEQVPKPAQEHQLLLFHNYFLMQSKTLLISSPLNPACIGKQITSFAMRVATGRLALFADGNPR